VKHLRNYNKIPVFVRDVDRSWVTMEESGRQLETGSLSYGTMIRKQFFAGASAVKHAPWTIRREI